MKNPAHNSVEINTKPPIVENGILQEQGKNHSEIDEGPLCH